MISQPSAVFSFPANEPTVLLHSGFLGRRRILGLPSDRHYNAAVSRRRLERGHLQG